ncbi:MAG: type II toxin-antitoxin system VapC family toxin [bacterium]
MNIIVDASVAVKWFFAEDQNEAADRLLADEYFVQAPDFLFLEVANILWKKWYRNEMNPLDDEETIAILFDAIERIIPTTLLIGKALRIAKELNHPVYDCIYLAAAQEYESCLITADFEFLNRVKNSSHAKWITGIGNPTL